MYSSKLSYDAGTTDGLGSREWSCTYGSDRGSAGTVESFDILARLYDGIPQFLDASAASFRMAYTDGNGRMRRVGGVESL